MQNSVVVFICIRFRLEITFLDKLGPKNQTCQFKLKLVFKINSNMQNSMLVLMFSVLDRKHTFWVNLFQKIKFVILNWNLGPRLIPICRIQWWCSLFLFYTGNTHFGQPRGTKRDYCLCDITRVETLK